MAEIEKHFPARELMRCAQRETSYRRFVYEKRVATGKMTRAKADEEIAMMDAIARHFGALADEESPALDL